MMSSRCSREKRREGGREVGREGGREGGKGKGKGRRKCHSNFCHSIPVEQPNSC